MERLLYSASPVTGVSFRRVPEKPVGSTPTAIHVACYLLSGGRFSG